MVLAIYFPYLGTSFHRESIGISVMPNIKVRDAKHFYFSDKGWEKKGI